MFAQLGAIIDQLYDLKLSGKTAKKKCVFIIGNGIRAVSNILNDDQLSEQAHRRGINPHSRAFREFKWRLFEYARYFTANTIPTFAHCCICQMIMDGICRDVITTNYDLYFDSIWAKTSLLKVRQNPICKAGEYAWDGYYTHRASAHARPRFWKIHGSLSHVVFLHRRRPDLYQLHKLPAFPISTNQPDLSKAFGAKCLAPFMGQEAVRHPRTAFTHPDSLKPQFEPFIDWTYNNKRFMFDREIRAAARALRSKAAVAAIVIIGFRGYYNRDDLQDPWNEELVPAIDAVLDDGQVPVFMALHRAQHAQLHEPTSALARRLERIGRYCVYDEAGALAQELLLPPNCSRFPFDTARNEYEIWRTFWYRDQQEGTYA